MDDDLDLTNIEDDTDNHVFGDNTDYTGGGFGTESTGEEDPFVVVEEMPKPFGNVTAWIAKYTKYPPVAQENGVQGKVTVQFVDRKSTRLNSSHPVISYAVFCLKKKNKKKALPSAVFSLDRKSVV